MNNKFPNFITMFIKATLSMPIWPTKIFKPYNSHFNKQFSQPGSYRWLPQLDSLRISHLSHAQAYYSYFKRMHHHHHHHHHHTFKDSGIEARPYRSIFNGQSRILFLPVDISQQLATICTWPFHKHVVSIYFYCWWFVPKLLKFEVLSQLLDIVFGQTASILCFSWKF